MELIVNLSRLQFAVTAMYHFLFVPLTLGLVYLLAIMESVYVMTGKEIWRQMTKFWGLLFGINFAMGVATGITLEFQFGTNWAYYSHYVGDIFGSLLAIEGLMAFFLEATFIGLFFFGWNKLSRVAHLIVTWLLALGTSFSALWILIANAWMQYPIGSVFNPESMRMELTSFYEVFFNPVAQCKFVHTVSAGYVTGAMFMVSISAYFLLRGRHLELAKRSITVAASFGLASALSVVVLGDESGYTASEHQKMKIAAIEAMWETKPAPASLTAFGIPSMKTHTTSYAIEIPWILGLIVTRSFDEPVPGIKELVIHAQQRISNGLIAYKALQDMKHQKKQNPSVDMKGSETYQTFIKHSHDLGHALLLKRYREDILKATPEDIDKAASGTIPNVPVLFWSFRIMVALGLYFIGFFAYAFYRSCRRDIEIHPRFLKLALYSLPLPWVAIELGWIVAEYGRQPWAIESILPTFLGVSAVSLEQILFSLGGFILFYTILLIVDVFLMIKYIKIGPSLTEQTLAEQR